MDYIDELIDCGLLITLAMFVLRRRRRLRPRRPRRFGIHPINRQREALGHYATLYQELREDHQKFVNYTRLSMRQFDVLDALLSPTLTKYSIRDPIPPTMRVLITLRYYASGDSMASISYNFRIGRSTVSKVVRETGEAMWTILRPRYLAPPTEEELRAISGHFHNIWNVPNCIGAIDGKHVIIRRPCHSGSNFFNYKKDHSIVLMACVDAHLKFMFVNIGAQGSLPDGAVFRNSSFGSRILENTLPLPPPAALPGSNVVLPHYFLADDAFPLHINIMKPYSQASLQENMERKVYNYRQSRGRMVVERAFGVLAGKWQIFLKPLTCSTSHASIVVQACVCLHNFIVATSDPAEVAPIYEAPVAIGGLRNVVPQDRAAEVGYASQVRDRLCAYFFSPAGSVPWQVNSAMRRERP